MIYPPALTLVIALKSAAHSGLSLPSILAATVLIQLPPTTTRFLSDTEATSESLTIVTAPVTVPVDPGVIDEATSPM
jgi:hypothetical protein